jgi:hypothetical protein
LCENDRRTLLGPTPIECPVLISAVASKRESAIVKDPYFIPLSKFEAEYAADVKFLVYMNGVGR